MAQAGPLQRFPEAGSLSPTPGVIIVIGLRSTVLLRGPQKSNVGAERVQTAVTGSLACSRGPGYARLVTAGMHAINASGS